MKEEIKEFGDLFVKRTKEYGGFEIWNKTKNRKICFFNEKGMIELAKWIKKESNDEKRKI